MQYNEDYFNSEDFKELLDSYETALQAGEQPFMDADDLVDLADYYNYNGEGDKAAERVARYADPDTPEYARMVDAICRELNFTTLKYHRLDDMLAATGVSPCKLCTYCWNGRSDRA